jgi:Holliday junction resolvasome RuvABC DNA-binding subunit
LHAAEEIFGKEHVAARIRCRQQQWRKRSEDRAPMSSDTLEQARRGLVNLGFAASEVNKTLVALADRHGDAGAPPVPELLREAIAALT